VGLTVLDLGGCGDDDGGGGNKSGGVRAGGRANENE
jgi:hypothetical protein